MKRVVFLALVSILVLAAVSFAETSTSKGGLERIYNTEALKSPENIPHKYDSRFLHRLAIDSTVYLEPVNPDADYDIGYARGGMSPYFPRGVAQINSGRTRDPYGNIKITVKELPPIDRKWALYEAWLLDTDTGYYLSLGTSSSSYGTLGRATWHHTMRASWYEYDKVVITEEPVDDEDLNPGPHLLEGDISKLELFESEVAERHKVFRRPVVRSN